MAVAYQSVQTTNYTVSASVIITKPVSLAVGDLMVALVSSPQTGSVLTPPTGWTLLRTDGTLPANIYWIIATATETAAVNFTWVTNGTATGGFIMRFTGTHQTAPIDQSNGADTTTPSCNGITPSAANSYFVMFATGRNNAAIATTSGYAVATNDPTWTEVVDTGASLTNKDNMAAAYGSRTQTTASGTASAAFSQTQDFGTLQIFNIIPPTPAAVGDNFQMGANF